MNHLENLSHNSSLDYKETVVQAVMEYINSDCQNANLTKIAEDTHQSMTVLSKLMKQKTGYTFQELLQRKRFQKAVYLLVRDLNLRWRTLHWKLVMKTRAISIGSFRNAME